MNSRFVYPKEYFTISEVELRELLEKGKKFVVKDLLTGYEYRFDNSGSFLTHINGYNIYLNRTWFLPLLPDSILREVEPILDRTLRHSSKQDDIMNLESFNVFLKDLYDKAEITIIGEGDFPPCNSSRLIDLVIFCINMCKTSETKIRKVGKYKITRR